MRKPFGAVPVKMNQQEARKPIPAAESFLKHLRLCAITDTEFGVRVGFVDLKSKPPKSYYLALGDSEDGIELVDADYEEEAAFLRKGAEEGWIRMSGGAGTANAPLVAVSARRKPSRSSYAERRRRRREAVLAARTKLDAQPRLTGEALKEHLEQYQMNLIRAGGALGPPLPLPLTKKMDDQLVAEGVLSPLEK